MQRARKYTTYNKIRLSLFIHSYACFSIVEYIRLKYKIDERLTTTQLRRKYFNKRDIPEIAKLSRVMNLDYKCLWEAIILRKNRSVRKQTSDKTGVKIYLCIEDELIQLARAKWRKSDYVDLDYEDESATLSFAIERAVGNCLSDIDDDFIFEQQSENLRVTFRKTYYKTAWRYKLPTLRIIPFILRLITTRKV
jgi:hypothetical protein